MKTVYLIRHGQSEGNIGPIRQGPTTPLTEHGREQAAFMAERCTKLPIEILVSSTMTRAQETASIIGERLNMEAILSDVFIERRRPSVQNDRPVDDPDSLAIDKTIFENFATPNYRYSDEENFEDLKIRAEEALVFLAERPEEHIALVTHGLFLRVLMASVVFGNRLTGKECELFMRTFMMENTGLTILNYIGEKAVQPWIVRVWNDHAHLG